MFVYVTHQLINQHSRKQLVALTLGWAGKMPGVPGVAALTWALRKDGLAVGDTHSRPALEMGR